MNAEKSAEYDFKGIGFSKIGHFSQVRSKIKETERLNMELGQRNNKLEAILNSMTEGLAILDRELTIVYVNQAQKQIFSQMPLIGKKCYQAFYGRSQACCKCHALKTLETSETFRGETVMPEGGRYYEWTTSPVKDSSGYAEEVILLMKDITERKEYEFKLMEADRMAGIGFLAAALAHEINNPLTSIAGFSEGILKRLNQNVDFSDPDKQTILEDYIRIIHSEAYRCKDIIKNILDFSRKSVHQFDMLPVDRLIEQTLSLVRQHAKDHGISLVFQNLLAAGFNHIRANEPQLKYVFLTLFRNAFEILDRGSELTISAKTKGNMIEIALSESDAPQAPPDKPEKQTGLCELTFYNIFKHHKGEIQFDAICGKRFSSVLRFPVMLPKEAVS